VEVIVVGSGPAGWAVADACAREGLDTLLVDPDPFARWPATYGLWEDQIPEGVRAMRVSALAAGRTLSRGYAVLDNDSALAVFSGGGARAVAGSVVAAEFGSRGATVVLVSGVRLACAVVIDASGVRRVLSGGTPRGARVEQTAFGVVVPADTPLVTPGAAVFMDGWSTLDDEPTFLYAVPRPSGGILLEETSLVRKPGLPQDILQRRLTARLDAAGVAVPDQATTERVRFAVDVPPPTWWRSGPGPVSFGTAAGMTHPATGYSVGDALTTAPLVAAALREALPRGAHAATAAARAVVWSPAARTVHRLRSRGMRTLLAMPARAMPEFFDEFFTLPDDLQRAYLSGREDVRGTSAAMITLFRTASWRIRRAMALSR